MDRAKPLNKPCKVTRTTQTHLFRNSHHTGDASSHLLQRCDRRTRLFVLERNEKRFLEQATLPRVLARLESHLEQRKVDEKDKLSSQTKSKADCTPKLSRAKHRVPSFLGHSRPTFCMQRCQCFATVSPENQSRVTPTSVLPMPGLPLIVMTLLC